MWLQRVSGIPSRAHSSELPGQISGQIAPDRAAGCTKTQRASFPFAPVRISRMWCKLHSPMQTVSRLTAAGTACSARRRIQANGFESRNSMSHDLILISSSKAAIPFDSSRTEIQLSFCEFGTKQEHNRGSESRSSCVNSRTSRTSSKDSIVSGETSWYNSRRIQKKSRFLKYRFLLKGIVIEEVCLSNLIVASSSSAA